MINIVNKEDCCGCTACENICNHKAISMCEDEEGFRYPVIDSSKCVDCGLCDKVCPIIMRDTQNINFKPLKVYGLYHKDRNLVSQSSSGGIFTTIANQFINEGGIVYGVGYDNNMTVRHMRAETQMEMSKFRGSKYVQSDLSGIFKEIKEDLKNNKVLFVGTPCQTQGLKNYLIREYPNLLTIDLVCHGVPSPKVFADYITYANKHLKTNIRYMSMKDKSDGWRNPKVRLECEGFSETGTVLTQLWYNIYFDSIVTRPVCHKCRWSNYSRSGDFTIGDFWGIEKSHPEFANDFGTSLLFINSKKGSEYWDKIKDNCEFIESSIDKCQQEALTRPCKAASDREQFWISYLNSGFKKTMEHRFYISKKRMFLKRVQAKIFRFLNS
jgi:4Fe-4S ferredoxin iron-sulfur binding domain-containing protein